MTLSEQITQLVVNDYFTPNIKAEVILDTLLTPYIGQIVEYALCKQNQSLTLLTKEMPISESCGSDNRGTKIDYVLEDKSGFVYLVELKTAKGSINAAQVSRYTENCGGTTFGAVIGKKLLTIMGTKFKPAEAWTTGNLLEAFQGVVGDKGKKGEYENLARLFLKRTGSASTRKYLYTVGQILDRCDDLEALWSRELRLVYLTPDGENVFPNIPRKKDKQKWEGLKSKWDALYVGPCGPHSSASINLRSAVQGLQPKPGDELFVEMLQSIISKI